MATKLINAAGGNWSAGGTWVGGVAPGSGDDVNIAALTATLTIDGTSGAPNLCRSFVSTGAIGTLAHTGTNQLNIGDGTTGAFTLVAGLTYAPSGTAVLKFVSTTTGNNITSAGKTMPTVIFDGVGGGWQFQDNWTGSTSQAMTLTNGALDTNGKTVSAYFSSSNSNTRSLTLGATNWSVLQGSALGWDITTSTGMTLSAASSTITLSLTVTSYPFNGGGLTYGTVTATALTTGTNTISGANTFGTLTLSMAGSTKGKTAGYSLSANQTVTGTFTAAGNSAILRNFIYSDTMGTARTITAATVTVTNTDFRDITGAGAGSWNFSALTSNANGDGGNNTGMTFVAPKNCYLKVNAAANWSASNWFTTSGGSTPISPVIPMLQDTAIIDANASFSVTRVITLDEPRFPATNWTGAPNTPTFATGNATPWELYGSLTLISGMTHTGTATMTYVGRGSSTFNSGTLTWPTSSTILVDAATGTITLSANLTSNAGITTTSGTFAGGGFTVTLSAPININGGTLSGTGAISSTTLIVAGGTYTQGATHTLTGAITISSGTWDMNGFGTTGGSTLLVSGGSLKLSGKIDNSSTITINGGAITDTGASGELKGSTLAVSGGTHAWHKMTLSSTFAISSTAALTINPGVSTWVTSYTETGTTHSLTYNGTATNINGTLTVTAASAGGGGSFTFS